MADDDDANEIERRLAALGAFAHVAPSRGSISERLAHLEQTVDSMERTLQPMIDVWKASKLLFKLMFVVGGFFVGLATIATSIYTWFGHRK